MALFEQAQVQGADLHIFHFNLLMNALGRAGEPRFAMRMLRDIRDRGWELDDGHFLSVLQASRTARDDTYVQELISGFVASGFQASQKLWGVAIDVLGLCGDWHDALRLLHEVESIYKVTPDEFMFNAVLRSLSTRPDGAGPALELLREIETRPDVDPDSWSYIYTIRANIGSPDVALELLHAMRERNLRTDMYAFEAVMNAYAAAGDVSGGTALLRYMREIDTVPNRLVFNRLLEACGRAASVRGCDDVVELMQEAGMTLNRVSFGHIFLACALAGDEEAADKWTTIMQVQNERADALICRHQIAAFAVHGSTERCQEVMAEMRRYRARRPDLETLQLGLLGHAVAGDLAGLQSLWKLESSNRHVHKHANRGRAPAVPGDSDSDAEAGEGSDRNSQSSAAASNASRRNADARALGNSAVSVEGALVAAFSRFDDPLGGVTRVQNAWMRNVIPTLGIAGQPVAMLGVWHALLSYPTGVPVNVAEYAVDGLIAKSNQALKGLILAMTDTSKLLPVLPAPDTTVHAPSTVGDGSEASLTALTGSYLQYLAEAYTEASDLMQQHDSAHKRTQPPTAPIVDIVKLWSAALPAYHAAGHIDGGLRAVAALLQVLKQELQTPARAADVTGLHAPSPSRVAACLVASASGMLQALTRPMRREAMVQQVVTDVLGVAPSSTGEVLHADPYSRQHQDVRYPANALVPQLCPHATPDTPILVRTKDVAQVERMLTELGLVFAVSDSHNPGFSRVRLAMPARTPSAHA